VKERFTGTPKFLSLPTDYPRNPERKRTAGMVAIELSLETSEALKKIAAFKKTTLFTILISVYGLMLHRLSGQNTVVIGTAVSGRNIQESEDLIGFLINTVAIPLTINKNMETSALFEHAKHQVEVSLADQDLPFEKVIEELNLERSLSYTPLFQAMFAYQDNADIEINLPHLEITPEKISVPTAKTDITLHFSNTKSGILMGAFEYDADLFAHTSVLQWADTLVHLLNQIAENPNKSINQLSLMNTHSREEVLTRSTGKFIEMAEEPKTLVDLFERSVTHSPNLIAILSSDTSYTYDDLNKKVDNLAQHIRRHVSNSEKIIAVLLERSPEFIISLLAILKTGNTYLPLSLEHPLERIGYILSNSQASLLITDKSLDSTIKDMLMTNHSDIQILNISPELLSTPSLVNETVKGLDPYINFSKIHSAQLAYMIYTSGSTGMPKGVAVPHQGAINMVKDMVIACDIHPNDRYLQFASPVFDGSIQEIFSTFYAMATLVMPSKEMRMNTALSIPSYIKQYSITHMTLPPSLLESLDIESLKSLKNLVVAGEACPILVAEKYSRSVRMVNAYGPTEASVCATYSKPLNEINLDSSQFSTTPIGHPIANIETYILDQYLDLVPDGVIGELYISGVGVTRGYYENPTLTSQTFLPCPFILGEEDIKSKRMYKTGDLVKRRYDGNLEFIGRVDRQIKLRGYRIELGEIEACFSNLFPTQISQVVIHPQFIGNEMRIIAYYSLRDQSPPFNESEIKSKLQSKLPDYMLPFAYIELQKIPLTSNGKIDLESLPIPSLDYTNANFVEPKTPLEILICQIYSEITGSKKVGIKDSFFDLGGHSLSAIKLVSKLLASTGREIPVRIVFTHSSPESLANYINAELLHKSVNAQALALNASGNQLPLFCIHPAGGYGTVYKHLSNALGKQQPVWALQARGLEVGETPDSSISEMANNYVKSILEIQSSGPFRLLGWSIGGIIAHEMAVILEEMGHSVSQLILLDSPANYTKSDDEPSIDIILYELIKEHSKSSQSPLNLEHIPEKFPDRLVLAKEILVNNGHISEDTPLSWIERSLNQFALSVTRLNHHIFRKCNAQILYFSATDTQTDSKAEWASYTDSKLKVIDLDSIHSQMVDEKYSRVLAEFINNDYFNQEKNANQ
jgi:amino acid adenylation domain-containing protein